MGMCFNFPRRSCRCVLCNLPCNVALHPNSLAPAVCIWQQDSPPTNSLTPSYSYDTDGPVRGAARLRDRLRTSIRCERWLHPSRKTGPGRFLLLQSLEASALQNRHRRSMRYSMRKRR